MRSLENMPMNLGKYVVARPRAGGTTAIAFEVPKRLRPEGWPATIPLPHEGRSGNLEDLGELERIKGDAAALLTELNQKRTSATVNVSRSWNTLIRLYEESSRFQTLSDTTKRNYTHYLRRALKYLVAHPGLQPETIRESDIEMMLASWNHSRDMKTDMFCTMKLLLEKAVREKWRPDNPTANIICERPGRKERKATIWELEDMEAFRAACIQNNEPGIATLIETIWNIGQRLTDVRNFRHGEEYTDGYFRFHQSKTGKYVTIPATERLRALLDTTLKPGGYLFINPKTNMPFSEMELCLTFAKIRETVPDYARRPLYLRNLRHSCVVQLARSGCTIPEIASITGHSYNTVHIVIEHYLPRDNELAARAIAKRAAVLGSPKLAAAA
jgi:site-specific recombinase XerD